MMPLLEGLDGVAKMSKSLGNAIGITDSPKEMFGKVMSISDEMMNKYYTLLTDEAFDATAHPKEAKVNLAKILVRRFHGNEASDASAEEFDTVFSKKSLPSDVPTVVIPKKQISLTKLLVEHDLTTSLSEARRLIAQGGVTVDGEKIMDTQFVIENKSEVLIKAGKRKFLKVKFNSSSEKRFRIGSDSQYWKSTDAGL
jgi:tyrosyl-tRNA synthetase